MKIHFTNNMTKNTLYTLAPLNWLLRTIGLSNVYSRGTVLKESTSKIKNVTLIIVFGFLNIFCFYWKTDNFIGSTETGLIKFNDCIQILYWLSYFEYIVDVILAYKYGRDLLLNYIKQFDLIDGNLGVHSYDVIRKTVTKTSIFCVSIFCINIIIDYLIWFKINGWRSATVYSIDYLYFFVNMLTILDTISHIIQVEERLKVFCNLLQNFNTSTETVNLDKKLSVDSSSTSSCSRDIETTWFSKCYLLILNQVSYVNNSYGFRVFMYCFNLLINVISHLNMAIRVGNGTLNPSDADEVLESSALHVFLPAVISALRAINYEVIALTLIHRCEQTYKQNDKILEAVDELLLKTKNCKSLKKNLKEMRNLLITRPIKFHAAKFFTLDYTLLVSLNSVVVTYTIIMLQSIE